MKELAPDICVIGGGSGGLSVAAGAAKLGASVVLCEGNQMGGDCLHYGCVPSKALIEAARVVYYQMKAPHFGVHFEKPRVNFAEVQQHIQQTIAKIQVQDSVERFTRLGVVVLSHYASFIDSRSVQAGDTIIRAKYYVLATGARPHILNIEGLNEVDYLTNETIFSLKELPKHLIIIGGGPIGLELASAYALLGAQITILETRPNILGHADGECAEVILSELRRLKVTIHTGVEILQCFQKGQEKYVEYRTTAEEGEEVIVLQGSHLLIATGRAPAVQGLDLHKAQVMYTHRGIPTDDRLRTNRKNIYAVGDVLTGPYRFTHAAGYQAKIVLQNILFKIPARTHYHSFPWVLYTTPELAHVGQTMKQALQRGKGVQVLVASYESNDRAQAGLVTEGIIKVAVDKKGRIMGVTIAGENAGELLAPWTFAMNNKLTLHHMAKVVIPYPTLGELNHQIIRAYYERFFSSKKLHSLIKWLLKW